MKAYLEKFVKFVRETRAETKKVIWPDRRYVTAATVIILVIVLITGLYVTLVDLVFVKIFGVLLK